MMRSVAVPPVDDDGDFQLMLARLPRGTPRTIPAILSVVDDIRADAIRAWVTRLLTRGDVDPDIIDSALRYNDGIYAENRARFADRLRKHGIRDAAVNPAGPPRDARETEQ
jgi:hypothetical protein